MKILPAYTLGELMDDPPPQRPIAIRRWCREGDLILITAPPDSFKSTFAMEMVWSLTTGDDFLRYPGWRVERRSRVLIVQTEIDVGSYVDRYRYFGRTDDIVLVDLTVAGVDFHLGLTDWMWSTLDAYDCDTLLLDPVGEMWPLVGAGGGRFSENSNDDVGPVLRGIKRMQAQRRLDGRPTTVIMVHHDPKPQQGVKNRAAGASYLLRAPDVRIFLDRKDEHRVEVTVKNRLQAGLDPQVLRFTHDRRLEVSTWGQHPLDKGPNR